MKLLKCVWVTTLLVTANGVQAMTLPDITGDVDAFGITSPGIACKTRTNNEGTVRNLAHGVLNRDSDTPVALNCGWPTSFPWTDDRFANSARVDGTIFVYFVRTAGTPLATANQTTCNINVSDRGDTGTKPSINGVALGTVTPNFNGAEEVAELELPSVSTGGVTYPGTLNLFSMFCQLSNGVRIQTIRMSPSSVIGTF